MGLCTKGNSLAIYRLNLRKKENNFLLTLTHTRSTEDWRCEMLGEMDYQLKGEKKCGRRQK